jgi:hypothetical protein
MAYTTRFGKLVRLHNSYTPSGKRIKDAPRYDEPKLKADKGEMNGSCNRTACQKPGADWFNHSTRKYYCANCAYDLNTDRFNHQDAWQMYGHDLCTPGREVVPA